MMLWSAPNNNRTNLIKKQREWDVRWCPTKRLFFFLSNYYFRFFHTIAKRKYYNRSITRGQNLNRLLINTCIDETWSWFMTSCCWLLVVLRLFWGIFSPYAPGTAPLITFSDLLCACDIGALIHSRVQARDGWLILLVSSWFIQAPKYKTVLNFNEHVTKL